jgi:hypothetical protein
MNRLGKSLVLVLVILAITQLSLAGAQPSTVDTGISISSPKYVPYQNEQYENTTATLNIKVTLVYGEYNQSWIDTVHLDSICYSLDGQPLVYINEFAVENYTNYGINQQDFLVYTASIKLENLSGGNHTVAAYANDAHNKYAYLNTLSAKYGFVVKEVSAETPSPSVPEFPVLAIMPLLLSILTIAVIARHRKNTIQPCNDPFKREE